MYGKCYPQGKAAGAVKQALAHVQGQPEEDLRTWGRPLLASFGGAAAGPKRKLPGLQEAKRHSLNSQFSKKKQTTRKNIRLLASPSKKAGVDLMRKARISCYRSKVRVLKSKKKKIEMEFAACKSKLENISTETLERLSHEAYLTEGQQLVLKECVAASKTESKKGRRYSDNWILLCLLLHIRSPAGYKFLMENEVLALPSVRTICRYVSMVGFKSGFDQKFFAALGKRINKMADFKRHGMIIFDEMQVRKSRKVNSKSMTYVGLTQDAGDDAGELADHALVFMFCPFGDSYAQPIGVFAAKNATKG
ncbi:hypothetical protein HPB48_010867 [Haemaphysalis longicornis]|uniref:Transposable element P transposase-like RNase H domain-containing protein n=1 Tax=Haemaphysalis longicornis TaxID=44386 RepID=A0A9J6G7N7_HAELO|nr:hypothetical protein HPB48_010867 [Haemaphysalis longicornis]